MHEPQQPPRSTSTQLQSCLKPRFLVNRPGAVGKTCRLHRCRKCPESVKIFFKKELATPAAIVFTLSLGNGPLFPTDSEYAQRRNGATAQRRNGATAQRGLGGVGSAFPRPPAKPALPSGTAVATSRPVPATGRPPSRQRRPVAGNCRTATPSSPAALRRGRTAALSDRPATPTNRTAIPSPRPVTPNSRAAIPGCRAVIVSCRTAIGNCRTVSPRSRARLRLPGTDIPTAQTIEAQ